MCLVWMWNVFLHLEDVQELKLFWNKYLGQEEWGKITTDSICNEEARIYVHNITVRTVK